MSLQARIRAAIKRHGLTQEQFAQKCGIQSSHLSTIINYDRDVRMSTYRKIDSALTQLERESA